MEMRLFSCHCDVKDVWAFEEFIYSLGILPCVFVTVVFSNTIYYDCRSLDHN